MADRLDRGFFTRAPDLVARDLVGCTLVRTLAGETVSGRIVETEAYGDETDLASHAAVYRRSRTEIMRSVPGSVYVYQSYGVHFCFNIVAHLPGGAGAVLIRAAEPIVGIQQMAERRGVGMDASIANGPGRFAQAFAFSMDDNGIDVVVSNDIQILSPPERGAVQESVRVGITRDTDRLWRYFDPMSNFLSRRSVAHQGGATGSC